MANSRISAEQLFKLLPLSPKNSKPFEHVVYGHLRMGAYRHGQFKCTATTLCYEVFLIWLDHEDNWQTKCKHFERVDQAEKFIKNIKKLHL